jgi:hypothetical protein
MDTEHIHRPSTRLCCQPHRRWSPRVRATCASSPTGRHPHAVCPTARCASWRSGCCAWLRHTRSRTSRALPTRPPRKAPQQRRRPRLWRESLCQRTGVQSRVLAGCWPRQGRCVGTRLAPAEGHDWVCGAAVPCLHLIAGSCAPTLGVRGSFVSGRLFGLCSTTCAALTHVPAGVYAGYMCCGRRARVPQ